MRKTMHYAVKLSGLWQTTTMRIHAKLSICTEAQYWREHVFRSEGKMHFTITNEAI
jgi:hypothetical protein